MGRETDFGALKEGANEVGIYSIDTDVIERAYRNYLKSISKLDKIVNKTFKNDGFVSIDFKDELKSKTNEIVRNLKNAASNTKDSVSNCKSWAENRENAYLLAGDKSKAAVDNILGILLNFSNISNMDEKGIKTGILTKVFDGIDNTGYDYIYRTLDGRLVFKDYKQCRPAYYAEYAYNKEEGTIINNMGCGTTEVATILSALFPELNITPDEVTREILDNYGYTADKDREYKVIGEYLDGEFGIKSETVAMQKAEIPNNQPATVEYIKNELENNNVIIVRYVGNEAFYPHGGSEGGHFVSIVDVNENGDFMVLNPGFSDDNDLSGWFSGETVVENMQFAVSIDTTSIE